MHWEHPIAHCDWADNSVALVSVCKQLTEVLETPRAAPQFMRIQGGEKGTQRGWWQGERQGAAFDIHSALTAD